MNLLAGILRDAAEIPQMKRGQVWCTVCGNTFKMDAMYGLTTGWPKCCSLTMTIDSPEEREAFKKKNESPE